MGLDQYLTQLLPVEEELERMDRFLDLSERSGMASKGGDISLTDFDVAGTQT